jgi:hypothetical protein
VTPMRRPLRARLQPARELVGPPAMRVEGGNIGVGERVTDRDDSAGLVRSQYVDPIDEAQSPVTLPTGMTVAFAKSPGGES